METFQNQFVLLTFDVEDWFQVENFKPWIPQSTWSSYELRVEKSTHRLLDILDAAGLCKATFFVLFWIAQRLPHLIREIHARGHEVASHGWKHVRCDKQSTIELKNDLEYSKKMLEDTVGAPVYGYRAPSFSINEDVLKVIADCGYLYDSSFNSFSLHDRYGMINLAEKDRKGISARVSDYFYELPVSNMHLRQLVFPLGGGAYFRLLPFALFKTAARQVIEKDSAFLFYAHPWEVDPDQPRVNEAGAFARFKHYANQKKTADRLKDFIMFFKGRHFCSCSDYLRIQGAAMTTFTSFHEDCSIADYIQIEKEYSPSAQINTPTQTILDTPDCNKTIGSVNQEQDELSDRGYGLILMRQIMDSVNYFKGIGSDGHNELVMEKKFSGKISKKRGEPYVSRLALGSSLAGINSIRKQFTAPAQELERELEIPFFAHHLLLAIIEAFTNAVEHGHNFDERKTVWILLKKDDSGLVVRITDDGKGSGNKQLQAQHACEITK